MTLNLIRQVTSNKLINPTIQTAMLRKVSNLYTPDYLEAPIDPNKIHKQLYIQLEGFDYSVLERYQSFITKTSRKMGLNVTNSFPLPHKELEVDRYKPNSEVLHSKYIIKLYQRIVQVDDVDACKLGSWIRVLEGGLPSGVQLHVDNYTENIGKKRFIPNSELLELKARLESKIDE